MKYLDIDIKPNAGSNILVYPTNYQSEIGNFAKDHLYYDDDNGNPRLLLCIKDTDFNLSMIRDRVIEVNENNAKSISEAKEQRFETITDEAKVRRIEIKASLGIELTNNEEKAIDPNDDSVAGFGITKILADRIEKLKEKEINKIK